MLSAHYSHTHTAHSRRSNNILIYAACVCGNENANGITHKNVQRTYADKALPHNAFRRRYIYIYIQTIHANSSELFIGFVSHSLSLIVSSSFFVSWKCLENILCAVGARILFISFLCFNTWSDRMCGCRRTEKRARHTMEMCGWGD